MATVTDEELVTEIKTRLGITGDYQNFLLLAYANDVKEFLFSAGVPSEIISDTISIGCIARGVADLWNLGSGDGKFSELFFQRAIQLSINESEE